MALLHQDGMDLYTTGVDFAMDYATVSNMNVSTSGGRFGGGAAEFTVYGAELGYTFGTTQTEIWVGFAVYIASANVAGTLLNIGSSSGVEASFAYNSTTSTVYAYKGKYQNSLIGSAPMSLGYEVWHWIEFHYLIGSSAGTMEVWLDGVQILDLTNVNNTNYGSSSFNSVMFMTDQNNTAVYTSYIDDLYILNTSGSNNNARLGDCRIITLEANSDASPNNGTPYSGTTHYGAIDEAQWSSSNYLTITNTSGQEELFGFASLSTSPSNIWAVRVLSVAEKTDAGSANGEMIVKSSSASTTGPSTPLLTSWSVVDGLFPTDPNTSSAWTVSAVNSINAGYKVP